MHIKYFGLLIAFFAFGTQFDAFGASAVRKLGVGVPASGTVATPARATTSTSTVGATLSRKASLPISNRQVGKAAVAVPVAGAAKIDTNRLTTVPISATKNAYNKPSGSGASGSGSSGGVNPVVIEDAYVNLDVYNDWDNPGAAETVRLDVEY